MKTLERNIITSKKVMPQEAERQREDQPDVGEDVLARASSLERGLDGRISIAIGSDSSVRSSVAARRGEERAMPARKMRKIPPQSPQGTLGANSSDNQSRKFSDNTTKYLGGVYSDYVRDLSPAESTRSQREGHVEQEALDITRRMQHDFNMKLAETIDREAKEVEDSRPIYAEVGSGRKVRNNSRDGFRSENHDATIDKAFAATFEEESKARPEAPVMGAEAAVMDNKKREKKHKREHRGEKEKKEHKRKHGKSGHRQDRRESEESGITEAGHEKRNQARY